jgi:hypothetical protein
MEVIVISEPNQLKELIKNNIDILFNMPYKITKIPNKNKYKVTNKNTGKVHAKSTTLKKAKAQVRLLESKEK